MLFRPVGAEVFHADGQTDRQTDMTKLKVAVRSFANAHKSSILHPRIEHCISCHSAWPIDGLLPEYIEQCVCGVHW